jgi:hypothetical protein
MSGCKIAIVPPVLLTAFLLLSSMEPAEGVAPGKQTTRPARDAPPGAHSPMLAPHGRPQNGAELTDSQKEELLGALRKNMPGQYAFLMRLKAQRPEAYAKALRYQWQIYRRWKDAPPAVQEASANLTEIHAEIGKALKEFKQAGEPEKAALKQKLRELLASQFDAEQVVNSHRLATLEDRIKEMRAELNKQAEQREQTLDYRLRRLLEAPAAPRGKASSRPHAALPPGPPREAAPDDAL